MGSERSKHTHQRQETLETRAPPINGPSAVPKPRVPPIKPVNIGRLIGATTPGIKANVPTRIPEHPRPAIARPMMKATELGAAPQTAEPTMNRTIETM